jgi:hypothetical protein
MLPNEPNKPSADDVQHQHKVLGIYLELAQYPILARKIRERMRQELFAKHIVSVEAFEAHVRERAVLSQQREGVSDPFGEEATHVWNERLAVVRDQLTDFYFAYNLPRDRLEEIIQSVLAGRIPPHELRLTFNPELAPWELLFTQGEEYESLPPDERARFRHHLQEIIVVLTRSMVSDKLAFVGLAKELFSVRDLREIWLRRIGRGRIGGKAAGVLLAHKILQLAADEGEVDVREHINIPESYFVGADVFYEFLLVNNLSHFMNQKYRSPQEIEQDYPLILDAYLEGRFPADVVNSLRELLEGELNAAPLVVRSSSLLEDNFGTAFAGKYESFFCPNQGALEANLEALLDAIKRVYASVLKPDALLYRQRMGLLDYDERMAVLIQKVQGAQYKDYFFPQVAGVGYSRNPFRWNPKIRREDGFLRLVFGLGTRAVARVANDYPRIMALSHPQLRPEVEVHRVRKYSQRLVDLLNLQSNKFETLRVRDVIGDNYPALRYLVSVSRGGYLAPIISRLDAGDASELVLTFDRLAKDGNFIALIKTVLKKLERYYKWPVDIEFTVDIKPGRPRPQYTINVVQCRPLVSHEWSGKIEFPDQIPPGDLVFLACKLIPQGVVSGVRYIVHVDPEAYNLAPDYVTRLEVARVVGRLNKRLEGERFILMGPGRWGSSNPDLGVKVTYADIYNAKVLVEIPLARAGGACEASYGTHFFQDLVETGIYPLPITPGEHGATLNTDFIASAPNQLARLLPADSAYADFVQVVDVPEVSGGRYLKVIMSSEQERAVGYLKQSEN